MKKVLETHEEIRNAMIHGRDISLEICAEFKEEQDKEQNLSHYEHEIGELIEKNGHKGIYAGEYERKPLILALEDLTEQKNWHDAIKNAPEGWRLPSRIEWLIMLENKDKINAALEKHGGKILSEDDWYWSSSEYDYRYAWVAGANNGGVYYYDKAWVYTYVRCVLA